MTFASSAEAYSLIYTADATATGEGRGGKVVSGDGRLDLSLSLPSQVGGDGGPGTNPEQLFAAGYAACFLLAMRTSARILGVKCDSPSVRAIVGLTKNAVPQYRLSVRLEARLPGVKQDDAKATVHAAHQMCPYSRATRGDVDVVVDIL